MHTLNSNPTLRVISLQVNATAEYLWTSGKTHTLVNLMEFCSILNKVIRDDYWDEIQVCRRSRVLSDENIHCLHLQYSSSDLFVFRSRNC